MITAWGLVAALAVGTPTNDRGGADTGGGAFGEGIIGGTFSGACPDGTSLILDRTGLYKCARQTDAAPPTLYEKGSNAYSQAATYTTGGDTSISAGIGLKKLEVKANTAVTIYGSCDGVRTSLASTTDFALGSTNNASGWAAEAANIVTAWNANVTLAACATASTNSNAFVYLTPVITFRRLFLSSSDTARILPTNNTDGSIKLGQTLVWTGDKSETGFDETGQYMLKMYSPSAPAPYTLVCRTVTDPGGTNNGDFVCNFGYNVGAGGGALVANEPVVGDYWESSWGNGGGNAAKQVERHIQVTDAAGVTWRPISLVQITGTSGSPGSNATYEYHAVTTFEIDTRGHNGDAPFYFSTGNHWLSVGADYAGNDSVIFLNRVAPATAGPELFLTAMSSAASGSLPSQGVLGTGYLNMLIISPPFQGTPTTTNGNAVTIGLRRGFGATADAHVLMGTVGDGSAGGDLILMGGINDNALYGAGDLYLGATSDYFTPLLAWKTENTTGRLSAVTSSVALNGVTYSALAGGLSVDSSDLTAQGSTAINEFEVLGQSIGLSDGTTRTLQYSAAFYAPTLNGLAGGGTETFTAPATVYIDGAPSGSNSTITTPYSLFVDAGNVRFDGLERQSVDARTIADDGAGGNATLTLTPTASYVEITCQDAQGCDVTMGESNMEQGMIVTICIAAQTAGATNFADTSGVTELAGAFAANLDDCLTLRYGSATWREMSRSAN